MVLRCFLEALLHISVHYGHLLALLPESTRQFPRTLLLDATWIVGDFVVSGGQLSSSAELEQIPIGERYRVEC